MLIWARRTKGHWRKDDSHSLDDKSRYRNTVHTSSGNEWCFILSSLDNIPILRDTTAGGRGGFRDVVRPCDCGFRHSSALTPLKSWRELWPSLVCLKHCMRRGEIKRTAYPPETFNSMITMSSTLRLKGDFFANWILCSSHFVDSFILPISLIGQ